MKEIDQIDQKILDLLTADSRLSNKQIGEIVHRTGQAIGLRIEKLKENGILKKYTIEVAIEQKSYIRLFLKVAPSEKFERLILSHQQVLELNKIAGQACYIVVTCFSSHQLNAFLEEIEPFATYTVETVIKQIKP